MSEESVQFAELVRQAHAALGLQPNERRHFCPICCNETPHSIADLDKLREQFTCQVCGFPSVYTVR